MTFMKCWHVMKSWECGNRKRCVILSYKNYVHVMNSYYSHMRKHLLGRILLLDYCMISFLICCGLMNALEHLMAHKLISWEVFIILWASRYWHFNSHTLSFSFIYGKPEAIFFMIVAWKLAESYIMGSLESLFVHNYQPVCSRFFQFYNNNHYSA